MIDNKTLMPFTLRTLLMMTGIVGAFICALLLIYHPSFPRSVLGWLALFFVGLPVWFFLEWLGERVLNMGFFSQLSSLARTLIAIPFVIALVVLARFLVQFVQTVVSFA